VLASCMPLPHTSSAACSCGGLALNGTPTIIW
jgi:hypothetical protein